MFPGFVNTYRDKENHVHLYFFPGIDEHGNNIYNNIDFLNTHINSLYKELYGMASNQGQISINGVITKIPEGISKNVPVTGTIPQWSENMNAYLRSAMSYANIKDIKDFNPENVTLNIISNETQRILLK